VKGALEQIRYVRRTNLEMVARMETRYIREGKMGGNEEGAH